MSASDSPQQEGAPQETPPPAPAAPRGARAALVIALLALLVAIGSGGWIWYDQQRRFDAAEDQLARRLHDVEAEARGAKADAQRVGESLREAQADIKQLDTRLAQSQSERDALQALYQELSRNRDEWQLAEVEQVLAIAQQQLELAGNVRSALLALQFADSRLAQMKSGQFQTLQRAIESDIEKLKATPTPDLPALASRLDRLATSVDSLPLGYEVRMRREAPDAAAPPPAGGGFWRRLGAEIWAELRGLVVVRRMGSPEPPLLAPTQAYFLRQNLRLVLLNARLSLLAQDEQGFHDEVRTAQDWVRRYFDPESKRTAEVLSQLGELASTSISFQMPDLTDTLDALRALKARHGSSGG